MLTLHDDCDVGMWMEVITPLRLSDMGKQVDSPVQDTGRLPVDTGKGIDGNRHTGTRVAD